ncbi:MAG: S8 family serine peptidase [Bacteroidales bacterium]|nr:S8 family serine peptidase [Candidatus Cacconaster merdequi]
MRRLPITLAIISVAVASFSCEKASEFKPEEQPSAISQETTFEAENRFVTIEVTDALSAKLLSAGNNEANDIFGPDVKSVTPVFIIGGKWEKAQRESGLHHWFTVEIADDAAASKASASLEKMKDVLLVEPRQMASVSSIEMNDPRFGEQWDMYNIGQYSYAQEGIDIELQESWDIYGHFGNESVTVAVIDGGVDYTHEDLAGNMWVNEAELNGVAGKDDDGNGVADDIYGINVSSGSITGEVTPCTHGTHVAGTIGAINGNGKGICSVAGGNYPKKGVRLMSGQIFDESGKGHLYLGPVFQYAAENGAVIAQNSWGYDENGTHIDPSDKAAIDYFIKYAGCDPDGNQRPDSPMKGGLVIFSAGNESTDHGWPGQYEKCISVAAIAPTGQITSYSNFGPWVDVCAPGGEQSLDFMHAGILSTVPNNRYQGMQGTSMACPHVSGLAALILSERGGQGYTCDDLREAIIKSCDPSIYQYNPHSKGQIGAGMISARLAFAQFSRIAPDRVESYTHEVFGNSILLKPEIPADEDDGQAYGFKVYIDGVPHTFSIEDEILFEDLKFEKEYSFQISAFDYAGNESAKSAVKKIKTNKNSAPVIECSVEDQLTVKQWQNIDVNITVTDPDRHSVTVSYDFDDIDGVRMTKMDDNHFKFTIQGNVSKVGDHSITVNASDKYSLASEPFELHYKVMENRAPQLVAPVSNICFNKKGDSVSVPESSHFSDEDGEVLSYTFTNDRVVTASKSGNNFEIKGIGYGETTMTITATDAMGKSASTSFKVVVRDGSHEIDLYPNPVTDILNVRTAESTSAQVTIFSTSGKKVFDNTSTITPFDPLKVDMKQMNSGTYTVVVKSGSTETRNNIVKL